VGVSTGLVISGHFAGSEAWRGGYWLHLALFAALALTSPLLPRAPASAGVGRSAGLFAAWGQSGPLRLSLTFAALVVMGFGLTTVYPQWFSLQHQVPVSDASTVLSLATLVMIPAGFATGAVLARGWRDSWLLVGLLITATLISVPLFMPGLPESVRIGAMVVWMVAQGSGIAVVSAALPRVIANPMQGAAAAGLLSQLAALVTFVTPLVWQPILQAGNWPGFVVVVAAAAVAAWLVFPSAGRARPV
jgi:hypothetical protein